MEQESFLFNALVYLASVVIFVPIAKRLGLGSVLGYLIAGVIIGPFVLGLIGKAGEDIMHFAEIGVVMMLFVIGLELQPELLWRMRKAILGLGILQLLFTTFIISIICFFAGIIWQQSLAIGLIVSMSSTAIVMQTLREKGLMKTQAGQNSFAVLLFQDIAVIPMLAAFPLLATLEINKQTNDHAAAKWIDGQPPLIHTLVVLAAIAGIIIVGRILVRPLLRVIAKTGIREVFTASALLIIVGIVVLMTQVGLSPALGAFLAGVVLANSEYRHELESDIEPFKGLLLGLFFIAVGASLDFPLIASKPLLIIGSVLILVIIKAAVLLLLGRIFKMSGEQNFIFSFSLSQVGEFAFVLLSLALQQGVLPQETVSFLTAVVAISMGLTPLVILANEKFILPLIGTNEEPRKEDDVIDETNEVIIAGFGHFGSTVGRFLRANNIKATYLDLDSDRVEVLRRMGFKVFYGDASRVELLQSAGASEAKIIIIAIDNKDTRLQMVDTIKKHFPHLHILIRSTNRNDAYDLMNAGMLHIYRETLDTSVRVGVDALQILGYRSYTARRLARTFLKLDELNLKKLSSIRNEEEYISAIKEYINEIELVVKADAEGKVFSNEGWDAESLREELKSSGIKD